MTKIYSLNELPQDKREELLNRLVEVKRSINRDKHLKNIKDTVKSIGNMFSITVKFGHIRVGSDISETFETSCNSHEFLSNMRISLIESFLSEETILTDEITQEKFLYELSHEVENQELTIENVEKIMIETLNSTYKSLKEYYGISVSQEYLIEEVEDEIYYKDFTIVNDEVYVVELKALDEKTIFGGTNHEQTI